MATRALAVGLLLGAAGCATEGGEPGGPRRPGTFRIVSEEPISDSSNVVRVKEAPGDSLGAASVAYAKAKAAYERSDYDAAIVGFSALALSPTPDQEYCVWAANLALDVLSLKKDFLGMSRFSQAYQRSACESAQRVHAEPREELAALDGRALASLQFLEGCWRHWSVDWGFTLCWKKEGARWLGEVKTDGAGAAIGKRERIGLRIGQDADGLVLTAGDTDWWLFRGLRRARVTVRDDGFTAAPPQQPALKIGLDGSVLRLSRGPQTELVLKREL